MTPSDIEVLHRTLREGFAGILQIPNAALRQASTDGNWVKAAAGSILTFELVHQEGDFWEWAQKERGARSPVFPLHPGPDEEPSKKRFWVTWFEEWVVKAVRKDLAPRTAGWTVFLGLTGQDKQQVIRAEWDQLGFAGSPNSGQPHWHVDRFLLDQTEVVLYAADTVIAELVPAGSAPQDDEGKELAGLHLAMGAWDGKREHPQCWQRAADTARDLADWALRTLQYLQSEFRDLR